MPMTMPPLPPTSAAPQQTVMAQTEREELLEQIGDLLEQPMLALSAVWLVLVVVDLAGYQRPWLDTVSWAIWAVFVLDFVVRLAIAPSKLTYLKTNWLTALALFAPALRLLRIARLVRALRAARAVRGLRLLRVVSTANRGLRTARRTLARRGIGYVLLINVIVLFLGAAGMFAFENPAETGGANSGLSNYGDALWWTAMLLTTLGAGYEPVTLEGRVLAWLLAVFAFAVFGYVTASIASLFVQQDRQDAASDVGESADAASSAALPSPASSEIAALRAELRALRDVLEKRP